MDVTNALPAAACVRCRGRACRFSEKPMGYYLHDQSSALRFQLSGKLAGAEVAALEQCRRTAWSTLGERNFLVDVSDLTTVDDAGRALLDGWSRDGAQFIATT